MSLEVSIRKAKLSDSKFLLKIHNEFQSKENLLIQ